MESRRYYICVDEGVYGNWHAIGVLEGLAMDEDIAQFLVALYSSQKEKHGEESSIRCVRCRSPLTLYCSTCQCPHLALPTQPPCPSVSSAAPALPSHGLDTSTALSVLTDSADTEDLASGTPHTSVKDEEQSAGSPHDRKRDVDLDIVKTESSFSTCDDESRSAEPGVTVHFAPSTRMKQRKSRKRWTRKRDTASGLGRRKRRTTYSPHTKKVSKRKSVDLLQSTTNLVTDSHVQGLRKKKKDISLQSEIISKDIEEVVSSQNKTDESCDDDTSENPNQMQRKRKPCASQDLEKGHILPAEERCLAQIHVYDESFIERHKLKDDSLECLGSSEKKQARQALIVKSVPKKRGRKKKKRECTILAATDSKSSDSEEEIEDSQRYNAQANHHSLTRQNSTDSMEQPTDSSQLHQASHEKDLSNPCESLDQNEDCHEKYPTLKQILSAPKKENIAGGTSKNGTDSQPFRILVSAEKILPLRTSSGNPAHNFYTYFECAYCRKAFTHKRAFNSHVQAHINKRIYKCSFCDRYFERPCDRIIHEKRHKYECEICGYKYLEYSMIKEHMKMHIMKCPGCSFETSDFSEYKKHKSSCEHLKPILQCEICGVRLKSQKALSFHIAAIHQNSRPFKCTLCEKAFVLQTKLNSHMLIRHSEGGKRFHCDKCGYRSFHAHSLKIHQMCVHSNERPFKCTHCPSAFARKVYLTVHLRKHTGEKPHRCSECLQTFTQRPSLTRHLRTHHSVDSTDMKKMKELQNPS